MIKILVVDDKPNKYSNIIGLLPELNLPEDAFIFTSSVKDATNKLSSIKYDLMILDMYLPISPWEEPVENGGLILLEHLEEDPDLILPKHIVCVTAITEENPAINDAFQNQPWILLKTSNGQSWEKKLLALIKHVVTSEVEQNKREYNYDVCIFTALRHPEFEAFLNSNASFDEWDILDSTTNVMTGKIHGKTKTLNAVISYGQRMGSTESALLTTKLIERYRPRIFAIGGICAGYEDKTTYGDVIVADPVWDYLMNSKVSSTPDGVKTVTNSPDFITVDEAISARFNSLNEDKDFFINIHDKWQGDKPRNPPSIFVAPSATGPAVIADSNVLENIRKTQHRATLGLEMEAYGVYAAVRKINRPKPLVFSAKSVCDYSTFLKDDKYQKYAAYTSAVTIIELLSRYGSDLCEFIDS